MRLPRIIKSGFRCCIGQSPDQILDGQDNSVLHMSSLTGDVKTVRRLIGNGARINITNKFGQTPLHLAAMENHTAAVLALLQSGGDVGALDIEGRTPLHYAAGNDAIEAAEALLHFGACPHRQDKCGQSAIFALYRKLGFDAVQVLLSQNDHYKVISINARPSSSDRE